MVSVIIPTHNRADIISETIRSVLNQTYSNIEVIIVSDGHQDNVKQLVDSFGDERLRYFEINFSGRPAVPRNFGIKKARGEYIAFCDDDDLWMSEKLQLQVEKMEGDEEVGLVYTKVLLEKGNRKELVPNKGKQGFIFRELFLSSNFIACSTVLIKRRVIETTGAFDEDVNLKATEDFDLWLRAAMQYKIGFIATPLAIHRKSHDSIAKNIIAKTRRHYLLTYKFYRENYVELGLFIKKVLLIFYYSIFEILFDGILNFKGGYNEQVREK